MELSLFTVFTTLWLCSCETDSSLKLKHFFFKRPTQRQASPSSSCPGVIPNTPEFFGEMTNQESDPERLQRLYSTRTSPRNTTTAQDFFKNREPNGRKQFIPQLQQDIGDACIKKPVCDRDVKYRTIDGFCNNLEFPEWGVSGAPFVRILPASYSDQKQRVRRSSSNTELPNARELHTSLLSSSAVFDTSVTYLAMTWGQLISHDTARNIDQVTGDKGQCLCCNSNRKEPSQRPGCLPLTVSDVDPFYSKFQASCLHFVRSKTTDSKNCIISPVQIISDVSHFLDASFLYGSTTQEALQLRTRQGGLLRSRVMGSRGGQFPPELVKPASHCPMSQVCFDAGDNRLNQNPMLSVAQVMFLRLHNRLADELAKINRHWGDETLYQEARKIVIAAVQRISYKEYLPVILGPQIVRQLQLASPEEELVIDQYDKFLNPGTLVSFTSAAYRVFHTMIPSQVSLFNERRQQVKSFRLSDVFFKPDVIRDRFPDFVRGLIFQPIQKINSGYTKEITELLFKETSGLGLDLVSADVMRGRDHGLPPYTQARISCGLSRPRKFQDLEQIMPRKSVQTLQKLYGSVDDVDLYLGAILETPSPGSPVGPTLQCIIVEQFRRWKFGDRFFYTFENNPGAFTPAQLAEVEKFSFSKIICIVSDVKVVQPNAFKSPDLGTNKLTSCNSLPKIDLNEWRD